MVHATTSRQFLPRPQLLPYPALQSAIALHLHDLHPPSVPMSPSKHTQPSAVHELEFRVPSASRGSLTSCTADFTFLDCVWRVLSEWRPSSSGAYELRLELVCELEERDEALYFPSDLVYRAIVKRPNASTFRKARVRVRTSRLSVPEDEIPEVVTFEHLLPCTISDAADSPYRRDDGSVDVMVSLFTDAEKPEAPAVRLPDMPGFLLAMFEDPEESNADVYLRAAGDEGEESYVRAHSNILRFRSPFFEKLLGDSFEEGQAFLDDPDEPVVLHGLSFSSLFTLIRALYGAPLPEYLTATNSGFMNLLEIWRYAAEWLLPDLADLCADLATAHVSPSTFVPCYRAAYLVGGQRLRGILAMKFYTMDNFSAVFENALHGLGVDAMASLVGNLPRTLIALDLARMAMLHEASRARRENQRRALARQEATRVARQAQAESDLVRQVEEPAREIAQDVESVGSQQKMAEPRTPQRTSRRLADLRTRESAAKRLRIGD